MIGTPLRDISDCREHGCVSGECIREGTKYVCKQGMCHLFFHFVNSFTHLDYISCSMLVYAIPIKH